MTSAVILERTLPHAPEKLWRALTESALIADWLMANDFKPVVGHRFTFRTEPAHGWSGIVESEVLEVEAPRRLAYRWASDGGLDTVVVWTLEPVPGGTRLALEQTGFRPQDERNRQGAVYGWTRNIDALDRVAGSLAETRSIVVERRMEHAPQKIWRALTQSGLIADWLMENTFEPVVGHRFTFRAKPVAGWSGTTNCEVLAVEPPHRLVYSWGDGTESASGLRTVVTWTLQQQAGGTLVRMEQTGFRPEDEAGYRGMGGGWPRILARLEEVAGAR